MNFVVIICRSFRVIIGWCHIVVRRWTFIVYATLMRQSRLLFIATFRMVITVLCKIRFARLGRIFTLCTISRKFGLIILSNLIVWLGLFLVWGGGWRRHPGMPTFLDNEMLNRWHWSNRMSVVRLCNESNEAIQSRDKGAWKEAWTSEAAWWICSGKLRDLRRHDCESK